MIAADSNCGNDEVGKLYEKYLKQLGEEPPMGASELGSVIALSPSYQAILGLGVRVLPFLVEDAKLGYLAAIGMRLCRIEEGGVTASVHLRNYYEGRADIPKAFAALYEKWEKVAHGGVSDVQLEDMRRSIDLKSGKINVEVTYTPAGQLYQEMKRLGILVVPLLVEKIAGGDTLLIPLLDDLTRNESNASAANSSEEAKRMVLVWWQNRKDYWTLPPAQECTRMVASLVMEREMMAAHSKSENDDAKTKYEKYVLQLSRKFRPEVPAGTGKTEADVTHEKVSRLGVRVLPSLVVDSPKDPALAAIGLRLCRIEPDGQSDSDRLGKYFEGRAEIPKAFAALYEKWKEATRKATSSVQLEDVRRSINSKSCKINVEIAYTSAGALYQEMKRLGVLVIPLLVEKIAGGDTLLIPLLDDLTRNESNSSAASSSEGAKRFVLSWWQTRKAYWTLPPVQDRPVQP